MKNIQTFERYFDNNDDAASQPTYTINYEFGRPISITCHKCGMISYSQGDIEHLYCGNCHEFHHSPYTLEEEEETVVHPRTNSKIFIDSEPSELENIDDNYTNYDAILNQFNYKGIKVDQAKGDVSGNVNDGFSADIEIRLTNGIMITYQHDTEAGTYVAKTKHDSEIHYEEFDFSQEPGGGYASTLNELMIKTLEFDF